MLDILKKIKYNLTFNYNDILSLIHLNKMHEIYLPWTGSAVNPAALRMMINEILINEKKQIIELGSGISTVFFEVLARQNNIKITSVDSDGKWQEKVKKMIINNGGDSSNINWILAPLIKYEDDFYKGEFYDLKDINIGNSRLYDFLFIDGPISSIGKELTRYPALIKLNPLLKDYVLFLHDASREGEKLVAKKWANEFDLNLIDYSIQANLFCLRQKNKEYYNIF